MRLILVLILVCAPFAWAETGGDVQSLDESSTLPQKHWSHTKGMHRAFNEDSDAAETLRELKTLNLDLEKNLKESEAPVNAGK